MSPTWFTIKSLAMTFVIVSILQLRIGSESKTLEVYFVNWMKSLSASKRIQDVAKGGKELTSDFIREFTTPDGRTIYIKESIKPTSDKRKEASVKKDFMDTGMVQRIISGIKLDIKDLNSNSQTSVKKQVKKEIEKELRNEYEEKFRKAGIDPKTLEPIQ